MIKKFVNLAVVLSAIAYLPCCGVEALLQDPEFCAVPWDRSCQDFHIDDMCGGVCPTEDEDCGYFSAMNQDFFQYIRPAVPNENGWDAHDEGLKVCELCTFVIANHYLGEA